MEPPAEAPSSLPSGHRNHPSGGRRSFRRSLWGLAILGLIAVGFAVYLLLKPGSGLLPGPAEPPREPFEFAQPTIKLTATAGSPTVASVRDEAEEIRTKLSEFYDVAFMNPDTWKDGLPEDIWEGYAAGAAAKAAAEPASLTLGRQPRLDFLSAQDSSLALNVLFDPKKRPTAVVAGVTFEAAGELRDGSTFTVKAEAQFLFQVVDGNWLITGFPAAKVKVDSEAPPSPEPTSTLGSPESSP